MFQQKFPVSSAKFYDWIDWLMTDSDVDCVSSELSKVLDIFILFKHIRN